MSEYNINPTQFGTEIIFGASCLLLFVPIILHFCKAYVIRHKNPPTDETVDGFDACRRGLFVPNALDFSELRTARQKNIPPQVNPRRDSQAPLRLVCHPGIEPGTPCLKGRCSAA